MQGIYDCVPGNENIAGNRFLPEVFGIDFVGLKCISAISLISLLVHFSIRRIPVTRPQSRFDMPYRYLTVECGKRRRKSGRRIAGTSTVSGQVFSKTGSIPVIVFDVIIDSVCLAP